MKDPYVCLFEGGVCWQRGGSGLAVGNGDSGLAVKIQAHVKVFVSLVLINSPELFACLFYFVTCQKY